MKRREFIAGLGAAAWPLVARAQQAIPPVIGLLNSRTAEQSQDLVAAVRRGLKEVGFAEGHNVIIEYRWAEGQIERLPALAEELVHRKVGVILAGGTADAVIPATSNVPIVFTTGSDPVAMGFVTSLNRPTRNVTGISFYSGALIGKQIELLRKVVPKVARLGMLVNPEYSSTEPQMKNAQEVAQAIGQEIHILNARTQDDFEAAFGLLSRHPNPGLVVSVNSYFAARADQLVALAARYAIPTIYNLHDYVQLGGLMSYGASITDAYRQAGVYVGRILNGSRPSELPVQLPTKFELVINLKTAKALGLTIPETPPPTR